MFDNPRSEMTGLSVWGPSPSATGVLAIVLSKRDCLTWAFGPLWPVPRGWCEMQPRGAGGWAYSELGLGLGVGSGKAGLEVRKKESIQLMLPFWVLFQPLQVVPEWYFCKVTRSLLCELSVVYRNDGILRDLVTCLASEFWLNLMRIDWE